MLRSHDDAIAASRKNKKIKNAISSFMWYLKKIIIKDFTQAPLNRASGHLLWASRPPLAHFNTLELHGFCLNVPAQSRLDESANTGAKTDAAV